MVGYTRSKKTAPVTDVAELCPDSLLKFLKDISTGFFLWERRQSAKRK